MKEITLDWADYRLFPYEKRLARREVAGLLDLPVHDTRSGLRVRAGAFDAKRLSRLTYFREVATPKGSIVPTQTRLEAAAQKVANGSTVNRQSTRYSVHGLHEYKGKFNPQVVRAVGNLLGLPEGAIVLDPFCGSGTTLVEAAHCGWSAVGLDLNRLAVYVSNVKLAVLRASPARLEQDLLRLQDSLKRRCERVDYERSISQRTLRYWMARSRFSEEAIAYLARWIPASVLVQIVQLENLLKDVPEPLNAAARTVMSDCLRECSWQDPADLRVRRRKERAPNYPLLPLVMERLRHRLRSAIAARKVLGRLRGRQFAVEGDVRLGVRALPRRATVTQCDAIIASPPYASALPYIDTQRLSHVVLGLLSPSELGEAERTLIGGRELKKAERWAAEEALRNGGCGLPSVVTDVCRAALERVTGTNDGFRRVNVPALLFRYFTDMSRALETMHDLTKPGGICALVVGPNRTSLGGETMTIPTPELLAAVAMGAGWTVEELVPLETYQRFDLHKENAIRKESLVVLKNAP